MLLSVRSGAAVSMPGMMDTVLNLGLTDTVAEALATKSGNPRFAYDSYRRFLDMFGDVVMGIPHAAFEAELDDLKVSSGVWEDSDLNADQLKDLVQRYKQVYVAHDTTFPEDPLEQMRLAIYAVFDSWQSDRAIKYMEVQQIKGLLGTAVNVQAMAFGNMGDTSGTGVLFTRDPNTGEHALFGEYLVNAQGEDVVAGIRTPNPISQLDDEMPKVYAELLKNVDILEKHFKDMQDIEFTVQEGQLFLLQTRSGKRGGKAAVEIAVSLESEGLVSKDQALHMVTPEHLDIMLHPQFKDEDSAEYTAAVIGEGLPASPGAAVGVIAFTTEETERLYAAGTAAILVRDETSPEDVGGMFAAEGILTARGGMTSHAAVVARGWGKPCVCGLADLKIDEETKTLTLNGITLKEGDFLSINGGTGEVLSSAVELAAPEMSGALGTFMEWVDDARKMDVLANADTPKDADEARKNGAGGIGLCRTEHMFFDHLPEVRRMIMAPDEEKKQAAIDELLPLQRADFEGIFTAMDGLPVTIRMLDPPLHEFVPHAADAELAASVGLSVEECQATIARLAESNPMLGLRGCRLGITSPEIIAMQARAVLEAALDAKVKGVTPVPKLMVPLIGTVAEYTHQADIIKSTAEAVFAERGDSVAYSLGTMIEVPRAALLASEVAAAGAEFFSYGTNDLTQMTYGYSRDDVGSFMPTYLAQGILPSDPFQIFDQQGVGKLVEMATTQGKQQNPDIKNGVCGEHGGEAGSVKYFYSLGHDYVSCSPFRVPIARLAAAQAATAEAAP
uniref:pyruvate, phosphate dikinase n=1 Tax=Florenciella parvula TaxID=236787 RepID=A0A7S2B0T5_9STRA